MNSLIQALLGKENKVPIGLFHRLIIWGCRTESLVHLSPKVTVFSISGKIDGFYMQMGKSVGGGNFEKYTMSEANELVMRFFSTGLMEKTKRVDAPEGHTFQDAVRWLDPRPFCYQVVFFEKDWSSTRFVKGIRRMSERPVVLVERPAGDGVFMLEFSLSEFETLCNDLRAYITKS